MDFIKKHINKANIITGRPQREERWDYPLNAIRELVINTIIHRDYTSPVDSIIKVYDDKIELFNPGKLPDGLTITKLLKGDYVSIARNKKIAEAFKSAGLIEKYGSGIKRILNGFKEYGLPTPEFREMSGGFMVTVYNKTEQATEQVTKQVERLLSSLQGKTLSGSVLMRKLGLSHRPTFLYNYIRPAIQYRLIEMTIPEKPQSGLQRYRLTNKGKKHVRKLTKK